jgi:hypothetical protein
LTVANHEQPNDLTQSVVFGRSSHVREVDRRIRAVHEPFGTLVAGVRQELPARRGNAPRCWSFFPNPSRSAVHAYFIQCRHNGESTFKLSDVLYDNASGVCSGKIARDAVLGSGYEVSIFDTDDSISAYIDSVTIAKPPPSTSYNRLSLGIETGL